MGSGGAVSIWGQRVSVWGFLRSRLRCKSEDGCFLGFLSQSRALCAAVWVRLGWFHTRVKKSHPEKELRFHPSGQPCAVPAAAQPSASLLCTGGEQRAVSASAIGERGAAVLVLHTAGSFCGSISAW